MFGNLNTYSTNFYRLINLNFCMSNYSCHQIFTYCETNQKTCSFILICNIIQISIRPKSFNHTFPHYAIVILQLSLLGSLVKLHHHHNSIKDEEQHRQNILMRNKFGLSYSCYYYLFILYDELFIRFKKQLFSSFRLFGF